MRELFVYYRLHPNDAATARDAVLEMQATLRHRYPTLQARLLCRPAQGEDAQTWMETYSTDPMRDPEGVSTAQQAAIEELAGATQPWRIGPRHTEVFYPCAC